VYDNENVLTHRNRVVLC